MTDWSCWRNRPLASLAAKPRTAVLIRRSARATSAPGRPASRSDELTPGRGDPLAPLPVVVIALATLIRPEAWRRFVGARVSDLFGAVRDYPRC